MSISNLYPTIAPSLNLDFANVKALDPRISFVRTTTATYYGTETAKAEENLLLQSEDFSTTWSTVAGGSTVTANTTTAPDGTATADTLTEDSGTSVHLCFQSGSVAGVATLSVFAKLGSGTRFLTIGLSRDTTNFGSATFDLSLGTNTQTQANGTYSSSSATITAVAESFYRCTLTVTTDTATSFRIGLNDTGTPTTPNRGFGATYTGDNTSSIILWGAQLEQRSAVTAYTPTTTQPITNYIPVLETAAAGVARFDHNPTTFESLGLLVEEQRTNLLTYSEEFDDSDWAKTRTSVTANTIVAPDGTLTGDKLVEDTTASSTHNTAQSASFTSGLSYAFSVYAKKGERTSFRSQLPSAVFGANVTYAFDLDAGTATLITAGTANSASITAVGNGWYRCVVTAQATATTTGAVVFFLVSGATISYTGNGFDGIYIWGAQLEAGAFPTSYIATTSASVTRNADAASMTGTNFSSWYRADEGSVLAAYSRYFPATANQIPLMMSDGTGNNIIFIGSNGDRFLMVTNNVTQVNGIGSISPAANELVIRSISYKVNDCATSANGAAVATDTSALIPVVNQLTIGFAPYFSTSRLNGHIRKLSFYPARLTDAQLQALTS